MRTPWPHPQVILAGMALVAAMAVQNAARRIHLASAPPSAPHDRHDDTGHDRSCRHPATVRGAKKLSTGSASVTKMSTNLLVFSVGGAAAAPLYTRFGGVAFRCSANHLGHHLFHPVAREVRIVNGFVRPLDCLRFGQAIRCWGAWLQSFFSGEWRRHPILVQALPFD